MLMIQVKSSLRHVVRVMFMRRRGNWLIVKGPSLFEGEETSFKEMERVNEFALDAQEVCEVYQTLMVIKVLLEKVDEIANVSCSLNCFKFFLQTLVLMALHI